MDTLVKVNVMIQVYWCSTHIILKTLMSAQFIMEDVNNCVIILLEVIGVPVSLDTH